MFTPVRALLVAAALIVCAWFVLGASQARDTERAAAIVNATTTLTATDAARARSLLRSAGTLNPDLTLRVLRGQLAVDQNDNATAERVLSGVIRSEPMNIEAWVQLAIAANQKGDKRTFARAGHAVAALEPPIK
jgi:predicted Zn-dependent protease